MNCFIAYTPTREELNPLVEKWIEKIKKNDFYIESRLLADEKKLLNYIFDGVLEVFGGYVKYRVKIFPWDLKRGANCKMDYSGEFAYSIERKSFIDFLEYVDKPGASVYSQVVNEKFECTVREYYLGDILCAITILNSSESHHHEDSE